MFRSGDGALALVSDLASVVGVVSAGSRSVPATGSIRGGVDIADASGIYASEQVLAPEDLYGAEEVFISSTNRNLLGIGEIAGHKFAGAPGPVTLKLEKALAAFVAEYVAKRKAARDTASSRRS